MRSKLLIITLAIATFTSTANANSADQRNSDGKPVAIGDAVKRFNKSNEESRAWAGESPLTEQELIAALVHESKTLSTESQQIADKIVETRTLPDDVRLTVFGRHSADRHKTYVYFIKLGFDKGPVKDKNGNTVPGRRRVENLIVRKRYLATQKSSTVTKMKSLEELLKDSSH
ncbi:hypothetical protein [Roseiconus lacunae]|uniref:hypothetical protein n=1 Tax=Roseiconus lacunae TaxID=2605694 RepID=UPI001E5C56F7|nr:hypothetical protein [Roseiconus lacunae]MCD0459084.1 hypothetical protein [Roseiconus lacunae]